MTAVVCLQPSVKESQPVSGPLQVEQSLIQEIVSQWFTSLTWLSNCCCLVNLSIDLKKKYFKFVFISVVIYISLNLKNIFLQCKVHCLGGELGAEVWEHLLVMIRCPFLALSATISNPERLTE